MDIEIMKNYASSYGEITPGCVTDFSIHCFNSTSLSVLKDMGVKRATLHPELNLAQIRDIKKIMDTEIIIYGKLPLMKLGNPQITGTITDRTGASFYIQKDMLYNSVPLYMADKLSEIEKSGVTHGRMIFTTENAAQVSDIIKAYKNRKIIPLKFTRGKF